MRTLPITYFNQCIPVFALGSITFIGHLSKIMLNLFIALFQGYIETSLYLNVVHENPCDDTDQYLYPYQSWALGYLSKMLFGLSIVVCSPTGGGN